MLDDGRPTRDEGTWLVGDGSWMNNDDDDNNDEDSHKDEDEE